MSDMTGTKEVGKEAEKQEEHKYMYQAMCILDSEDDCHTHCVVECVVAWTIVKYCHF